jgi:hypothetical protein
MLSGGLDERHGNLNTRHRSDISSLSTCAT